MHAILITGSGQSAVFNLAQQLSADKLTPAPDTLIVNPEPSIGISAIRAISRFLNRKPMLKDTKTVFLPQAEKLTLPAQQAFLKILEEPPACSLIILAAGHQEQLLATVVSRCELHPVLSVYEPESGQEKIFRQIIASQPHQRLALAAVNGATKIKALQFCQNKLFFLRNLMIKEGRFALAKTLRQISQTIVYLNHNVNAQLCLENLLLSY